MKGIASINPILWAVLFMAGMVVGASWPRKELETQYAWRFQKILPPDSASVVSPATGPFRADFCPEVKFQQYEARAGYVMCRIQFVNNGCIIPKDFTWVKNNDANQSTATLNESDTFKPWPDCHKEEETADAR